MKAYYVNHHSSSVIIINNNQLKSLFMISTADTISVIAITDIKSEKPREITLVPNECVAMVWYGEVEEPHVTVQPKKIILDQLKVYETRVESLVFRNWSKTLPLVLKYNDKVRQCVIIDWICLFFVQKRWLEWNLTGEQ